MSSRRRHLLLTNSHAATSSYWESSHLLGRSDLLLAKPQGVAGLGLAIKSPEPPVSHNRPPVRAASMGLLLL
jgi:hypothetical protein